MKILEVEKECYFIVGEERVKPEDLSKKHLLDLFCSIYQLEDTESIEMPDSEMLSGIKNPIEIEIVNQINQKIMEFVDNLEEIKQSINSSFPSLSAEESR